jgi:hypothetical protein
MEQFGFYRSATIGYKFGTSIPIVATKATDMAGHIMCYLLTLEHEEHFKLLMFLPNVFQLIRCFSDKGSLKKSKTFGSSQMNRLSLDYCGIMLPCINRGVMIHFLEFVRLCYYLSLSLYDCDINFV